MKGRMEYLHDIKVDTHGGHVTFENYANITIRGYVVLENVNFSIKRVTFVECLKHNI